MGKHYGKFEQWIFEPHVAEEIFDDYIKRSNVKALYHYRILKVVKDNGFIKEIIIESSTNPTSSTNKTIAAKIFIDCSYEGDLMARAGVSYTVGRESNNAYHETYNGAQLMGHQFPNGIDPYKDPGRFNKWFTWVLAMINCDPQGLGIKCKHIITGSLPNRRSKDMRPITDRRVMIQPLRVVDSLIQGTA
jgi:hypothetical protein